MFNKHIGGWNTFEDKEEVKCYVRISLSLSMCEKGMDGNGLEEKTFTIWTTQDNPQQMPEELGLMDS